MSSKKRLSHALSRVAKVSLPLPLPREESSVLLLIPLVLLLLRPVLEDAVSSLDPAEVLLVVPREAGLHLLWSEVGERGLRGLSIGLESGSDLCLLFGAICFVLILPYQKCHCFSVVDLLDLDTTVAKNELINTN
jgi:hypothetical protein